MEMHNSFLLQVNVTYGHRATIADVRVVDAVGDVVVTRGEALRHPTDSNDRTVGELLAVGRALSALGSKLERKGDGFVRMNDHNGRHSRGARMEKATRQIGDAARKMAGLNRPPSRV